MRGRFRRGVLALVPCLLAACSFGVESTSRTIPESQRGSLSGDFGIPLNLNGEFRLYLPRQDVTDGRRLGSVGRLIARTDTNDTLIVELVRSLVAGPTPAEATLGFRTAIPQGTQVLDVSPAAPRVTIDLTGPIAALPERELVVALAQIVYTMSEGFVAREIIIKVDGQSMRWPREDGSFTEEPLTIFDYPTAAITSQPAYPGIIEPETSS